MHVRTSRTRAVRGGDHDHDPAKIGRALGWCSTCDRVRVCVCLRSRLHSGGQLGDKEKITSWAAGIAGGDGFETEKKASDGTEQVPISLLFTGIEIVRRKKLRMKGMTDRWGRTSESPFPTSRAAHRTVREGQFLLRGLSCSSVEFRCLFRLSPTTSTQIQNLFVELDHAQ